MKSNLGGPGRKHLVFCFFPHPFLSHTFTSVSLVQDVFFFSPSLSWRDGENVCKRFLSLSLKHSQSLSSPGVIIGMSSSASERKPQRAAGMRAVPTASRLERRAGRQDGNQTGRWRDGRGLKGVEMRVGREISTLCERRRGAYS